MIPEMRAVRQAPHWQQALASAISDPAELIAALDLDPVYLPAAQASARLFPLRVPLGFLTRMRRGDPYDPLLRQVLPLGEECLDNSGFTADPVGDLAATVAPGVLQKYRGRVLLTATGACAVHCRYCFRRHFPYADARAGSDQWRAALDHLASDTSLQEVILSGGDPLTLSDRRLAEFINAAAEITHVARLRVHTRLPVVLPERVTPELVQVLTSTRLATVVVIHANHPNEIDASVVEALALLRSSGVTLLNQSVLLRGVNDSAEVLTQLSEKLMAAGVLPYYLHLLDRVQGAAHFDVPESEARALIQQLIARLPGYLVPRLVREIAGAPGKQQVI